MVSDIKCVSCVLLVIMLASYIHIHDLEKPIGHYPGGLATFIYDTNPHFYYVHAETSHRAVIMFRGVPIYMVIRLESI